ncbi:MAG: hypothetical protein ABIT58_10340, partial [Ferruginibacter sp.]
TQSPGGAVSVYLKKYDDEKTPVDIKQKYLTYKGYSITKEFYSPEYKNASPIIKLPDNRITLYWNPGVTASGSKNIKFDFFNNDISKKINIIVEGFDAHGKLLHYETNIGE